MAHGQRAPASLRGVCVVLLALAALHLGGVGFAPAPPRARAAERVRMAYDSGKVNLGVELETDGAAVAPQPVLECDEGCVTAIQSCLDEGCSVEAMMKLDSKLADDEREVAVSIEALKERQKVGFSEGNAAMLYWLENFLGRTGSLRGQLHTLRTSEADTDFVRQMVKAASVAFGGGRPSDYPKVGVSPYSA